jgi:phenylpyruvate tautomerase PptA (4-oxalocrotonate tautomerase family)
LISIFVSVKLLDGGMGEASSPAIANDVTEVSARVLYRFPPRWIGGM